MRRRLYLQIYLAFLLVAACSVGLAAGVASLMWDGGPEVPAPVRGLAEWVNGALPAPQDAAFEGELQRIGQRLQLDLTLWDASGARLGVAGRPMPERLSGCAREGWIHADHGSGMVVRLSDGRCLAAALRGDAAHPIHRAPAWLVFPLLFAAMAAGCYPIARRITWRLEALKRGVARWGSGDLSARVPVFGRDEVADLARTFNRAAEDVGGLMLAQKRVLASGASPPMPPTNCAARWLVFGWRWRSWTTKTRLPTAARCSTRPTATSRSSTR